MFKNINILQNMILILSALTVIMPVLAQGKHYFLKTCDLESTRSASAYRYEGDKFEFLLDTAS